jgi:hypothetical protein
LCGAAKIAGDCSLDLESRISSLFRPRPGSVRSGALQHDVFPGGWAEHRIFVGISTGGVAKEVGCCSAGRQRDRSGPGAGVTVEIGVSERQDEPLVTDDHDHDHVAVAALRLVRYQAAEAIASWPRFASSEPGGRQR